MGGSSLDRLLFMLIYEKYIVVRRSLRNVPRHNLLSLIKYSQENLAKFKLENGIKGVLVTLPNSYSRNELTNDRIGATGHIGGAVLDLMISTYPETPITVLIRTNPKAEFLHARYPSITTKIGSLSDLEILEASATAADIVISNSPHAPIQKRKSSVNFRYRTRYNERSGNISNPQRFEGEKRKGVLHPHIRGSFNMG